MKRKLFIRASAYPLKKVFSTEFKMNFNELCLLSLIINYKQKYDIVFLSRKIYNMFLKLLSGKFRYYIYY